MSPQDLTPPEELIFIGMGDFQAIGQEFLRYFIEPGGLKPNHRVLDLGCGIGRMAVPLTRYLTRKGGYDGFDIVPHGIDWCRKNITSRYRNFRFFLADIRNGDYNPEGPISAAEFTFPYPDATFDFAFATSLFTHMLPAEVNNYIREVARVLKPNGRFLSTFFLWNAESAMLTESGQSGLVFAHRKDCYRSIIADRPECAICYDESFILDLYGQTGLTADRPIQYGGWCGRKKHLSAHDLVIATRSPQASEVGGKRPLFSRIAQFVKYMVVHNRTPEPTRSGEISPAIRAHIDARLNSMGEKVQKKI